MTVLAVAHRAGNDEPSVQAALALGADVIEADVHRYRGRLELRHGKAVRPLPLLYDEGRLTTTRQPRPQLDWLLTAVGPNATIMVDLKGPGHVGRHVAEALRARAPGRPVLVCSRWWPGVDAFSDASRALPVLTARNGRELRRLVRRVDGSRAPYGVSLHRSLLTTAGVLQLRSRVALVMTWPVNDHHALDAVLAQGVNGIISDEPEVLRDVLGLSAGHGRRQRPGAP